MDRGPSIFVPDPGHIQALQAGQLWQNIIELRDEETEPAHAGIDLKVVIDHATCLAGKPVETIGAIQGRDNRGQIRIDSSSG